MPTTGEMLEWANIWVPESAQLSVTEVEGPDDGGLLEYAFRLTITLAPQDVAAFRQENRGKVPDERPQYSITTEMGPTAATVLGIPRTLPEGSQHIGPIRSMVDPPEWKDYRSIVLVGPDFTTVYVGIHSWYR